MMTCIRIVLEVIDHRQHDFVIRTLAAIEHAELAFEHAQQAFDVAMFLTQNLDHLGHFCSPGTKSAPGAAR